jgi:hypothetical protein
MNKPFDLKAALAGAPVRDSEGNVVRQLTKFRCRSLICGSVVNSLLAGVVSSKTGEHLKTWDENGGNPNPDLFMVPAKREGWVNLYPSDWNPTRVNVNVGGLYPSEEEANKHKDNHRIACIRIEWEE